MPRAEASGERVPAGVRQAGLTLLEVLGAVALLGILYTALAGNAIEGLRSEGESRRRLEASLLADDRLAELELSLSTGEAPKIGTDEEEVEGGFTVAIDVRPFELPPQPEDDRAKAKPISLAAKRAAARAKDAPSLFGPARTGAPSPLLTLDVVVRWEDGIFQREVRRTTYAVDAAAVEAAFESLAEFQAQRPPGESAGEDAQGGGGRNRQQEREARLQQQLQRQQSAPQPDDSGIPQTEDRSGFGQ